MGSAAIGRDEELAAIGAFLDGVWSGPRALVFAGEAGIGKTLLWETGVAQAKERVGRVLSCRGTEAEASLSFAALSELPSRRSAAGVKPRHLAVPGHVKPVKAEIRAVSVLTLRRSPGR
jgi:hypothetical protein